MTQPPAQSHCRKDVVHLALRHADLVYAAALRQLHGDASAAQDVTQAVMLVMLEKERAGRLPQERIMAGWLLNVTRYVVLQTRRAVARRSRHEQAAAQFAAANRQIAATDFDVRAALDDALLSLSTIDREVVVRRYLRNQSIAQVGCAVGMSENTAGRRIARAMDRLRQILVRRGVTTTTVAVAAVMGAEAAIKAPAICSAATIAGQIHCAQNTATLAKGALFMLATKKVALVCTVIFALLLGIGTTWLAVARWTPAGSPSDAPPPPSADLIAMNDPAPPNLPIKFSHGAVIELRGIHQEPADNSWLTWLAARLPPTPQPRADSPWWGASGLATTAPPHEDKPRVHFTMDRGDRLLRFLLEVRAPDPGQTGFKIAVLPNSVANWSGYRRNGTQWLEVVAAEPSDAKTADIQIGIGYGPWVDDITYDVASGRFTTSQTSEDTISGITLADENHETCMTSIGQPADPQQRDHRFIVKVGNRTLQSQHGRGDFDLHSDYFACAAADITQVVYQSRSFETMVIKNVSLAPTTAPTNVSVAPLIPTTAPAH